MKFLCANRIAPDVTPRFAASHLGLYCLPMSHKKDARLMVLQTHWKQLCPSTIVTSSGTSYY